jgi:hypothetical protein
VYHYYAHVIAGFALFLIVLALLPTKARSHDAKEIARDKLTEFCASHPPVPPVLIDVMKQVIEQNPQPEKLAVLIPGMTYLQALNAMREKLGCNDA